MNTFDKIIGYSAIKNELRQISDILKNNDVYANLGVSAPKGLLLYGIPGVGKSLMASAVIEESATPFSKEVTGKLRRVFIFMTIVELLLGSLTSAIIMALIFWTVYAVFEYGVALQSEVDETL